MSRRSWRRAALFIMAIGLYAPAGFFAAFPQQQPSFFATTAWGAPVSVWMTLGLMIGTVLLTALAALDARRGPRA